MKSKVSSSLVIGIILVVIAIGYIGNVFEVWHFSIFFRGWWTMFIIIPAVIKIAREGFKRGYVIWLGVGALLLIRSLGIIPAALKKLLLPLILLAVGFLIIFRGKVNGISDSYFAIFSGRTPNYNGRLFQGACCTALFGGVDLLLGQATIEDGAAIDALAIFGGVDVKLPANVNVEITGLPIFGGVSDPKQRIYNEAYPTIRVNAIAVFGGVSVK